MKTKILDLKAIAVGIVTIAFVFAVVGFSVLTASADHRLGATVTTDVNTCEPTIVSATTLDPGIANMFLVVDTEDTDEQFGNIPTDGSSVEIAVGPFGTDTTVSWRVFGGGERDYDDPHWNGYGGPTFSADITAYGAANGFGWVVAGTDDPNPFTTWNEVEVPGCSPEVISDCKNGGWEDFGFRNQGQCIRYVNTGQDSR
jgi:hypothetical protein